MHLRYVFSEVRTGLRRNVSMTVALVVTIFISLTLVGMGLLLNAQANSAEQTWGDKLQVTVLLCTKTTVPPPPTANPYPHCSRGSEVTTSQKTAITAVLKQYPQVKTFSERSKAQAYAIWKRIFDTPGNTADRAAYSAVTVDTMPESYLITLRDPNNVAGVETAISGMDGVQGVRDLRDVLSPIYFWMSVMKWGALGIAGFLLLAGILQVSNSIRLAVFARRKEIGIMRLVGASNLYISLPFLMETLVAALIAITLSGLAIAGLMQFAVYGWLRQNSHLMAWITWRDALTAGWIVAALGILLTAVPTLVMTRKYLKI